MTTQCISCNYFSLKRAGPELARLGFGGCAYDPYWKHRSAEWWHCCDRFMAVDENVAAERREWIERQFKTLHENGELAD